MSETKYSYSITDDFPNQLVNVTALVKEIQASEIVTTLSFINTDEDADTCDIWFEDALSSGDQTILDGLVAAHQGTPIMTFRYCAPTKLVNDPKDVTNDTEWQDLGGGVTNLAAFVPNVANAWGRITGEAKVSGSGAQLRFSREDGTPCSADVSVPDSSGSWVKVQFWANQNQPSGVNTFVLCGRLNGATSMEVRFFAVSVLEKQT